MGGVLNGRNLTRRAVAGSKGKGTTMKQAIEVIGRLPSNAHATLPEETPEQALGRFADSPRGRKAAWNRAVREDNHYAVQYGNAAAHRVQIRYLGWLYSIDSWEFRWGMDFSRAVIMTNAEVRTINRQIAEYDEALA